MAGEEKNAGARSPVQHPVLRNTGKSPYLRIRRSSILLFAPAAPYEIDPTSQNHIMAGPLTASSALSTIQQLVNDLSRAMREIGPLPALRELSADLTSLATYCQGSGVDVDVAVSGAISPEDAAGVASWISSDLEAALLVSAVTRGAEVRSLVDEGRRVVRIFPEAKPPSQKGARPRAPVLVWISAGASSEPTSVLDDILDDRPLVMTLRRVSDRAADAKLTEKLAHRPWLCESVAITGLAPDGLNSRLDAGGEDLSRLLRTYSALYGLETAAEALKLVIEQEQRTIRVKRATAQQKTAKLQLGGGSMAEAVADIRVRIQRTLADFEKSVQEGVAELFLPQIGSLSKKVDQRLATIDDLERTEGEKSIQLRVKPTDESELLRLVGDNIRDRSYADLRSFRDVMELLSTDIDRTLSGAGAPPVTLRHAQVPDSRINRVLDSAIRIERPYRGELPREGWQEFYQEARKSSALMTSAVTTPMTLISTTLPDNIRRRAVGLTGGLSIVFAIVGLVKVWRSLPRERAETVAREVDRARDVLRSEVRRMFSEAERGWTSAISDALRDEQSTVLLQFEAAIREGQSRRNSDITDEKSRLQRAMEGLQHAEGQLSVSSRTRDTVLNGAAQLRGGLRQLIAGRATVMEKR